MDRITQDAHARQRMVEYFKKHGNGTQTAIRYKVSRKTLYKWVNRYDGTLESLMERSHRPHHSPRAHTETELKQIRRGKKNRELYDLEIDPVAGSQVQLIFEMAGRQDMGTTRIANYLNEHFPDPNKTWTRATVMTMLKNPVYTGRMHMNDVLSEPNETLRLVSDDDFQFTQYALKKRLQDRYTEVRREEDGRVPEGQTKTSVYGAFMLSGLLWCGHCHHKLVGGYCTKHLPTHVYHRPIYRCYNGSIDAKECDGLTVYSAKKIETAVLEIAHDYFTSMKQSVDTVWKEQARRQMRSKTQARQKVEERNLQKLEKQQEALKQEILKSITGESPLDTDTLQSMLCENSYFPHERWLKVL